MEVSESSVGVDTKEDFERVEKIIEVRNIIIREAKKEDIPQIARVQTESWQKSFAGIVPQEFLDKMSVENRIKRFEQVFSRNSFYKMFVAETPKKKIVGFADFGASADGNFNGSRSLRHLLFTGISKKRNRRKVISTMSKKMVGAWLYINVSAHISCQSISEFLQKNGRGNYWRR